MGRRPIRKDREQRLVLSISHQKGMKHVRYCSFGIGSPEPALPPVDRRPAVDHPEPSRHRQEGQLGSRQPDQLLHRASLDNRASDINNLLDGIGNGVQVLQAANTGITSLQKLVDTAKSIAQQVLQAPVGYSTKASATTSGADAGGTCEPTCSAPDQCWHQRAERPDLRLQRPAAARHHHHVRHRCRRSQTLTELNAALVGQQPAGLGGRHHRFDHHHHHQRLRASATVGALAGTATAAALGVPARFAWSPRSAASLDAARRRGFATFASPREAVQQHHHADHHHGAGCVLQRHQPAERRQSQADLQRNRQVHAQHQRRDLQRDGSRPCCAGRRHGLPGQRVRRTR